MNGQRETKVQTEDGVRTVTLPDGYRRVFRGALKPGDRFLHLGVLRSLGIEWYEDADDASLRGEGHYAHAEDYALVIRPGTEGPDAACPWCETRAREPGLRFCGQCIDAGVHRLGV